MGILSPVSEFKTRDPRQVRSEKTRMGRKKKAVEMKRKHISQCLDFGVFFWRKRTLAGQLT